MMKHPQPPRATCSSVQDSSEAYSCGQVCHHRGTTGFLAGTAVSAQPVTWLQHRAITWPTSETSSDYIPDGISLLKQSKTEFTTAEDQGDADTYEPCAYAWKPPSLSALPRSSPAAVKTGMDGRAGQITVIQPLTHLSCYCSISSALGLGPGTYSGHHSSSFVLFTCLKRYPSFKGNNAVS